MQESNFASGSEVKRCKSALCKLLLGRAKLLLLEVPNEAGSAELRPPWSHVLAFIKRGLAARWLAVSQTRPL